MAEELGHLQAAVQAKAVCRTGDASQAALVQHPDAVTECFRLFQVVGGEKDRAAATAELANLFPEHVANLAVAFAFNLSTDVWVNFKLFGGMGLMFVFAMAQVLMLSKYVEEKK